MMEDRLTFCMKYVFGEEGGYVNNPNDKGGATKYGVTQGTYDAWLKRHGLPSDPVKNLKLERAHEIYRGYWDAARCALAKPPLDLILFDTAINFGAGRAIEFLQIALQVKPDKVFGPATHDVFAKYADHKSLANNIVNQRVAYRHKRVKKDPTQKEFLKGWLNRDRRLLDVILHS